MRYTDICDDCWVFIYFYLISSKYDIFNKIISSKYLYDKLDILPKLNKVVKKESLDNIPSSWLSKITYLWKIDKSIINESDKNIALCVGNSEHNFAHLYIKKIIQLDTIYYPLVFIVETTHIDEKDNKYIKCLLQDINIDTVHIILKRDHVNLPRIYANTIILDLSTSDSNYKPFSGKCQTLVLINCHLSIKDYINNINFKNLIIKDCAFDYQFIKHAMNIIDRNLGYCNLHFNVGNKSHFLVFINSLHFYKNCRYIIAMNDFTIDNFFPK